MESLKKILEKFDENRKEALKNNKEWNSKSIDEKYKAIAEWFRPCAKKILCDGYFLINNEYIVDLGAIELYYHEEDGAIKDPKMYHTNDKIPKVFKKRLEENPIDQLPIFYKELKDNGGYPYFEKGSFNLHQSGIDVTFENGDNKNDKYRASFLIRSYRMLKKEDINNKAVFYDPCSSHLYDDLYNAGLLYWGNNKMSVQWVKNNEFKKEIDDDPCPRRNLDLKPYQFQIKGLKDKELK